jgi:hypothetical protein
MLTHPNICIVAFAMLTILSACDGRPSSIGDAKADCGIADYGPTPALHDLKGETHEISNGVAEYIIYSDGVNRRMDIAGKGVVEIDNYDEGYHYFSMLTFGRNATTYLIKSSLVPNHPPKFRYWEFKQNACRVGPCQVSGVKGVEWSHPRAGGGESRACISPDGLLLEISDGDRPEFTIKSLVPQSIPKAMFVPPQAPRSSPSRSMSGS